MAEINPYAPPVDDVVPPRTGQTHQAFRQLDLAVVSLYDPRLPDRCVICNQPGNGKRIRRSLLWHPQWVYMTILIGLLIYWIIAAIVQKRATIEHSLCETHAARRRNGVILMVGGVVGGIGIMLVGVFSETLALLAVGPIAVLVCVIAGAITARTLTPARIDDYYAWLNVGRPFLESLPYHER
jgi:hypothetical protein